MSRVVDLFHGRTSCHTHYSSEDPTFVLGVGWGLVMGLGWAKVMPWHLGTVILFQVRVEA
jgi:hypothetical protein